MTWRRLRTRLRRSVIGRAQHDHDLDDEIRFHLVEEAKLQADRGVSPDAAMAAARRSFGSVALAKETTRSIWIWTSLEQLIQDVRSGCRIVTTAPGLTLTSALLVALVVGGNTTIFSMVHSLLRKPAAGVHGERLVALKWPRDNGPGEPLTSYANYLDLTAESRTLASVAAFQSERVVVTSSTGTVALLAGLVSSNYFQALGVRIVRGGAFAADSGSGLTVVISDRVWRESFGGADDAVGRQVLINGWPATIAGVTEPMFRGAILAATSDLWLPIEPFARITGQEAALADRTKVTVNVTASLAAGVPPADAAAELSTLWARLQAAHPELDPHLKLSVMRYSATADGSSLISRAGDLLLALLTVISVLTLLIVCANVANLLIARGLTRQRETALRQSLGASRGRVMRMLLAEGLVIAGIACTASVLLAWWVTRATSGFVVPSTQGEVLILPDFTPDWTVVGYASSLAAFAAVAFTLAPAVTAWRLPLLRLLRAGEASVVGARSRLTGLLVVIQIAFSVLLLTSAILAYRSQSLVALHRNGFDTRNGLLLTLRTTGAATATPSRHADLLERLRERLAALPGVEAVAYGRRSPFQGWQTRYAIVGGERPGVVVHTNSVSKGFLSALGVTLVAGREPDSSRAGSVVPALINQAAAQRLWPGESPLGRSLQFEDGSAAAIAGVFPDVALSQDSNLQQALYVLLPVVDQSAMSETAFLIRLKGSMEAAAPSVRAAVREVDDQVPIVLLRSMGAQREALEWPIRFLTRLLMLFAIASLLVAVLGQYGSRSFDTRRRVREFGLRLAVGASSRQLIQMVIGEGFRVTAIGFGIGLVLSAVVGQAMRSVLFGVSPLDPTTYAVVFAVIAGSSLLACYLPARSATQVDPIVTLRQD